MLPRIAIPVPHSTDPAYAERAFPQYAHAVEMAGGDPVRIPLDQSPTEVMKLIGRSDAVLLPGSKADIDPAKREAALRAGAAAAYDPADPNARKALFKATGGVFGAVDFVGSDGSLAFAAGSLAKGGKVVVTGLLGGTYTTPIAMFPLRVFTIEGTMTGTLDEANEMMALARSGKIPPVPIIERPLSTAQASLDDLRGGRVVGRVVLVP